MIVVPDPGDETTSTVPPNAPNRSAMFTNPWPSALPSISKPRAIVDDLEAQLAVGLGNVHRRRGAVSGVLAGVLQRFERAEYTAASMSLP